MPSIKFPVVKGKHVVFPKGPICPWCRKKKLSDAPGMAILNAGAMRPTAPECYTMAKEDAAFMALIWHSNDPSNYDDTSVEIAERVDTGQFELYFCSTACLRAFLNHCVDKLEKRRKPYHPRVVERVEGKPKKQAAKRNK